MGLSTLFSLIKWLFSLFKQKSLWLYLPIGIIVFLTLFCLNGMIKENANLTAKNQQLNQQLQHQTQQIEALQQQFKRQQQLSEYYANATEQQKKVFTQQQEKLNALLENLPHSPCLPDDSVRLLNQAITAKPQLHHH